MYNSDAKLFLNANNNINSAKTILNECIRLLCEAQLPGNTNYDNCKLNLENSGINLLIEKVETTKESLMKLDQTFSVEYMSLLQEYLETSGIDTSQMNEEERIQYNIQMDSYYRDYNYSLLYMLEKYEDSGMLTPELDEQLKMQKLIIKQYGVQDKMASLSTTSNEYIELFKQNADYDKKLINLNSNLTDEEKAICLKQYEQKFNSNLEILELNHDISIKSDELEKLVKDDKYGTKEYYSKQNEIYQLQIDFYNSKEELTDAEKEKLNNLKDYKKLNKLYIDKEGLGSNWIPFDGHSLDDEIFALKKQLGIATEDELEYLDMNGWERTLQNTGTFVVSVFEGIYNVEEQIFDGGVMICGEVGSWFGADTKWAEDLVEIDLSGSAYRGVVLDTGLNENIAYGTAHVAGNFTGEMLATISLQFLPGGTAVMTAAHGLKGMGSAGEKALQSGKNWDTAFAYGFATGTIEAGSAYLLYGKTPKANKAVDNVGNWFVEQGTKIPGLTKVAGAVSGGFNNIATTGMKEYAGTVLKSSLITKFLVAGAKEYAKEGASMIIDGEYDFKSATAAANQSMLITAFNEFVVSPAVNAATNQKAHGDKIKNADKAKSKAESKLDKRVKKMEQIKQTEAEEAKSSVSSLRDDVGHTSTGNEKVLINLQKSIEKQKDIIAHAYDDVNLWDELISQNFVNKFSKKVGSEFMKKVVFS